jgi:hypothetical protein
MDPNLPFFNGPTLGRGRSLAVASGEPVDEGRWRFSVLGGRHTLKARLLDFASKHNLRTGIGRFSFLDAQQILNPTNYTTNSLRSWRRWERSLDQQPRRGYRVNHEILPKDARSAVVCCLRVVGPCGLV